MDVNRRKEEIEDLNSFINSKQKVLHSVLDTLGWSKETLNKEVKVCCPINPEHWIPESALSHHKIMCEWVQSGYRKEEMETGPPDSAIFYEKSQNVIPIVLDKATQVKILSQSGLLSPGAAACMEFPRTVDRCTVQFSPQQRLAMYDYIVNAAKCVEKPKDVTLEDLMVDFEKKEGDDDKPKSQLELLAEMRDYKRRRQSYRAKNVHITKKSYTEVMKEVIENQMNYLVDVVKSEDQEKFWREDEESSSKMRRYHDAAKLDDHDNSGETSTHRDYDADYKSSSRKHKHSHHESSKHYSPKKKKHKKHRSRSRSRTPSRHKHKKSHKRKRSRD